jgi:3-oxoacyl-[acyl-carrier protein] reductase
MAEMGALTGKTALVTGGSRGIGRAIALRLAADGADVAVCARQVEAAEAVAGELQALGVRALARPADVASFAQAGALVEAVLAEWGKLDILVNNAGITRDNLLLRMSEEEWDAVLDTNLKGAFNCCKAAVRAMVKARSGRIINISSVVGLMGNAGQANYAASKAGLCGFTKSLARELASRNITANVVAPGLVPETGMTGDLDVKALEKLLAQVPLGRPGLPEDVAHAVAFLASEQAAYITGQVLCVDGGMVM